MQATKMIKIFNFPDNSTLGKAFCMHARVHVWSCKTLEETKELIEAGFHFVTDMDSKELFRKPK